MATACFSPPSCSLTSMTFSDDDGGFAFSCDDAKLPIVATTWNTKLFQLARLPGLLLIMTPLLPNLDYIGRIVGKRPKDMYISLDAEAGAQKLKALIPAIRIALRREINAKAVFLGPETVWIGSAGFGESKMVEFALGFHSETLFNRAVTSPFKPAWQARARFWLLAPTRTEARDATPGTAAPRLRGALAGGPTLPQYLHRQTGRKGRRRASPHRRAGPAIADGAVLRSELAKPTPRAWSVATPPSAWPGARRYALTVLVCVH